MRVHRTPYEVVYIHAAYYVVRPVATGGSFTISEGFNTEYEAEVEARRLWGARSAQPTRRAA